MKQGLENKLSQWDIPEKEAGLKIQHNETKGSVNEQMGNTQDKLAIIQKDSKNKFDVEKNKLLIDRSTKNAFPQIRQLFEKPFWIKDEE